MTLLTHNSAKLFEQMKSGFKKIINWNKYQSKLIIKASNPYFHYLIDTKSQGVNRPFAFWK